MRTIKNLTLLISASCASFFLFTIFAYASQLSADGAAQGFSTFGKLVDSFNATIVKAVGTLLMSLAVVAFFYGIVQYIWGSRNGDAKAIENGNKFIGWSLLALFVMFSVFGIVKFFQGIVPGLSDSKITIPEINIKGSSGTSGGNGVVCPDGSRALNNAGCSGSSNGVICPDGSRASNAAACSGSSNGISCPDGSRAPNYSSCPYVTCNDGSKAPSRSSCPDAILGPKEQCEATGGSFGTDGVCYRRGG